jgi:hypothetical protein
MQSRRHHLAIHSESVALTGISPFWGDRQGLSAAEDGTLLLRVAASLQQFKIICGYLEKSLKPGGNSGLADPAVSDLRCETQPARPWSGTQQGVHSGASRRMKAAQEEPSDTKCPKYREHEKPIGH